MKSGSPHVIQAALGTVWALQPQRLAAVAQVLARWASGEKLSATEIQARIGDGKGAPQQGAGVAVLPLYGIIGHRMNQVQDISGPGGTSTEQFGQWFDAALHDPAIGAIVLDIDSPGGSVSGVPELAAKIFAARGQKPIIAIANSLAASAAYWIGTAAEEFWCTPSGDVGSIGVYTMHQDFSAYFADVGITNTLVSAGKFKVEGNPYEPLDEEARAALQERIDEIYADFTKAVALHRGVTAADVRNGFGEGRVVSAVRAKRLGMIDKVGTLDTLLSKLSAGGSRSRLKAADLAPSPQLSAGAEPGVIVELSDHPMVLGYVEAAIDADEAAIEAATAASGMLDPAYLAAKIAAAHPSQGRAGVAAGPVVFPIHGADEAKEFAMSDKGTPVAEAAAQAALAAAEKENERVAALGALAADEGVSVSVLNGWVSNKMSVEQAMKGLLADKKAARAGAPVIRHNVDPLDGGDNGTKAGPFRTLADNLQHIRYAGEGHVTPQLASLMTMRAAVTGASATVGADGGFLIQQDHAIGLLESAFKAGEILSRCDTTELTGNSDGLEVVYLDEVSRENGSRWGGVQVFRVGEAPESVTSGKAQLGRWERRVEDIEGVAFMTERLLADAPAMADVFSKGFTEEFKFVVENECFRGTGVGQGLGIFTLGDGVPTVAAAKASGQPADTVVYENIQKMWQSVLPSARARGAWFINTEVEEQLDGMMIGTGTSGQLVYMPPGGISGSPYGFIKGRPVIVTEYSSGLGDLGDICFADWSAYKLVTKGGVEAADSMHVRFIQRERTFRWTTRVNGAPKDKQAIKPFKATNASLRLTNFATLAAR
jgi:HK97 family phage major capsid protein